MRGLLKIVSFLLMLFFVFLFLTGLFSRTDVDIRETVVIDAPVAKVWSFLTDFSGQQHWREDIKSIHLKNEPFAHEGSILELIPIDRANEPVQTARISEWENNKTIAIEPLSPFNYPLLENFLERYHLKRLVDGTTEITITCQYRPLTFAARIYSETLFKGRMSDRLASTARQLKKVSEKI